jgi:hypothetical protein
MWAKTESIALRVAPELRRELWAYTPFQCSPAHLQFVRDYENQ